MGAGDLVVLELSSFQLEDAAALGFSPRASLVTNVSPNHLDRHGTYEAYCEAKRNILRFQGPGDLAVLNRDDPLLHGWADSAAGEVVEFSVRGAADAAARWDGERMHLALPGRPQVSVALPPGFRLVGRHNVANALAACAAAVALGVPGERLAGALASFEPLEHRLELVREVAGLTFYNDSIATTPESAVAALVAFSDDAARRRPITLIAGGYDKHISLAGLAEAAAPRVDLLVTLGETGPALEDLVEARRAGPRPRLARARTLQEAVELAWRVSAPGAVVLLSPACASYDMFENFEVRGRVFREAVLGLPERARA
jgi:UDP-N-acetylmuramoylalanine--D-glutamate ligase